MPSLREIQIGFAAAVFGGGETADLSREIVANGRSAQERVAVYRRNVFGALTQALRVTYPVIDRLVGQPFFDRMAARYIHERPSTGGDLHHFGGGLAGFLAGFPPTAGLPYLPDVARLEWACHAAYHAAGHAALDPARLASVRPERYGDVRFVLHPAVRLISSPYPLHKIWLVSRPDYEGSGTVDWSSGGVALLVHRPELRVVLQVLSPGAYALLAAFGAGIPFAGAGASAMQAEPDFDLPAFLRRAIVQKTVVGFSQRDPSTGESCR